MTLLEEEHVPREEIAPDRFNGELKKPSISRVGGIYDVTERESMGEGPADRKECTGKRTKLTERAAGTCSYKKRRGLGSTPTYCNSRTEFGGGRD